MAQSSHARNRFYAFYNREKDKLIAAGLWTSFRDYPNSNSYEFELACEQYLGR